MDLSNLLSGLTGEQPDYSGGNDPAEEERKRLLAQQQADAAKMSDLGKQPAVSQAMASAGQPMGPAAAGSPDYAGGGPASPPTANAGQVDATTPGSPPASTPGWPSVEKTGQGYGNPTQTTGNASLGASGDSGLLGTGLTDKQRKALKQSAQKGANAADSSLAAAWQLMGQMQATNQRYLNEPDYSA
jgi:hypothetical protein